MTFPKFILLSDPLGESPLTYVLHTKSPQFIATVTPTISGDIDIDCQSIENIRTKTEELDWLEKVRKFYMKCRNQPDRHSPNKAYVPKKDEYFTLPEYLLSSDTQEKTAFVSTPIIHTALQKLDLRDTNLTYLY